MAESVGNDEAYGGHVAIRLRSAAFSEMAKAGLI